MASWESSSMRTALERNVAVAPAPCGRPATILRRRSLSARRCLARTLALTLAFAIWKWWNRHKCRVGEGGELKHRRTWSAQKNELWRTDHDEQVFSRRAQVYRECVYRRNGVQGVLCTHSARSHNLRVLFFGVLQPVLFVHSCASGNRRICSYLLDLEVDAKNFNFAPPHRYQIVPHSSIPKKKTLREKRTKKNRPWNNKVTVWRINELKDQRTRSGKDTTGKHLSFIPQRGGT